MSITIPEIILKNLLSNEGFSKRILPYIKKEYFENIPEQIIFEKIENFITKYNICPTNEALYIELSKTSASEPIIKGIDIVFSNLKTIQTNQNIDWLINTTEEFCKKRAIRLALTKSISIYNGDDENNDIGAIPDILQKALSVSFDSSIGHDYLEDYQQRYEFYHNKEEKIPLRLKEFNNITLGGVGKKTLNLILAGPHVGKSATLCNLAADDLIDGRNVLYISNEMNEFQISKRIDANIFEVQMDDLQNIPESIFRMNIDKIKRKSNGRLKVKEYPMASSHVGHYRTLLNELKLKQNFVPDVIYVDYLNIMLSSRLKASGSSNMYYYVKCISEELRGLASEFDLPVWSATQFNREGASSENPDMGGVSESFGVNFTADLIIALIVTDELKKLNQILCKQLKNRYDDLNRLPKFLVGIDRAKMKLYDI